MGSRPDRRLPASGLVLCPQEGGGPSGACSCMHAALLPSEVGTSRFMGALAPSLARLQVGVPSSIILKQHGPGDSPFQDDPTRHSRSTNAPRLIVVITPTSPSCRQPRRPRSAPPRCPAQAGRNTAVSNANALRGRVTRARLAGNVPSKFCKSPWSTTLCLASR